MKKAIVLGALFGVFVFALLQVAFVAHAEGQIGTAARAWKVIVYTETESPLYFCYAKGQYGTKSSIKSWSCRAENPIYTPSSVNKHLVFIGTKADLRRIRGR